MRVSARVYGALAMYVADRCESQQLEVDEGITAVEVLRLLGIPEEEVWLISVDNHRVDASYPMTEGEEISIFPPVTGG